MFNRLTLKQIKTFLKGESQKSKQNNALGVP